MEPKSNFMSNDITHKTTDNTDGTYSCNLLQAVRINRMYPDGCTRCIQDKSKVQNAYKQRIKYLYINTAIYGY